MDACCTCGRFGMAMYPVAFQFAGAAFEGIEPATDERQTAFIHGGEVTRCGGDGRSLRP